MIAIPDTEVPEKVDGIGINFHFEDGHIETYIIGIEEIIDIVQCKECKHRPYCCRGKTPLYDNGFCFFGERK